jgi:hypothetical protein
MMQRRSPACPSALRLDQYSSGELTPAERDEMDRHAAGCEACQRRHAELGAARRSFAEEAPPFDALRRETSSAHWRRWGPALGVAAALTLAVGEVWQSGSTARDADSATRTKGGLASASWVVRRGDQVFQGRPEQRLRPGDVLSFSFSARETVYAALLGLDAAGRVSVYYPESERLGKLERGRDQPLPIALQLDASPGDERVLGVFCREAVSVASVRQALEHSAAAPELPPGCTLERWTLRKEAP